MDPVIALVVAVYGYVIGMSFWAVRVQSAAARAHHHSHDHPASEHATERVMHGYIAAVLTISLAVRLVQLTTGFTAWVLVPLTVVIAWWTGRLLTEVWWMALDDLRFTYLRLFNRLKVLLLLGCATVLLADQIWRVVTLFWSGRPDGW